jgi:hypothetical protein
VPKFELVIVKIKLSSPQAAVCLAAAEKFLRSPRNWSRAFTTAAFGMMLCAKTTADLPANTRTPSQILLEMRAARLQKFFGHYHCPQPYYTFEYLRAADKYGIDYRLLPAISIRETQCGVTEKQNNRWGFHPGEGRFPSIEAGIEFMTRRLAQHQCYRGKNILDKLFTYNPRPAYPGEVQRIMSQIE